MGRDDRPRIYIKGVDDGRRSAWRVGWHGRDRHAPNPGLAMNDALEHLKGVRAVFFWEGMQDHD